MSAPVFTTEPVAPTEFKVTATWTLKEPRHPCRRYKGMPKKKRRVLYRQLRRGVLVQAQKKLAKEMADACDRMVMDCLSNHILTMES